MTLPSFHFRPQGDDIVHRFENLRVSIGASEEKRARVLRKRFQYEVAGYDFVSWHGHCHFPARRMHEEVIRNHLKHSGKRVGSIGSVHLQAAQWSLSLLRIEKLSSVVARRP